MAIIYDGVLAPKNQAFIKNLNQIGNIIIQIETTESYCLSVFMSQRDIW